MCAWHGHPGHHNAPAMWPAMTPHISCCTLHVQRRISIRRHNQSLDLKVSKVHVMLSSSQICQLAATADSLAPHACTHITNA